MKKNEYIELYNSSFKLFWACRLELDNVFESLKSFEKQTSFDSKKVGIYKHIKKLIPCFTVLHKVSDLNSIQSMITLQRMITDNYAIFYLFTNHSSKEEQLLRYYLFLLDATKLRPKILRNFSVNIKNEIPNKAYEDANNAIISDDNSSRRLVELIHENQLDLIVHNEIIDCSNWKFKDAKKKEQKYNRYNWSDLYSIARIPKHHASMLQNYNSNFVHGLGMSLMIENDDNSSPLLIATFDFCSILISMIIKILMMEFEDETKDVKLNKNTIDFMNDNWNDWK